MIGLVDWRFFSSMRRCLLLMASNFGRCLVTYEGVRPGQESKWPRWMARRKVEGSELKAQACRKTARSCFVERCRMVPFAVWRRGMGALGLEVAIMLPLERGESSIARLLGRAGRQ